MTPQKTFQRQHANNNLSAPLGTPDGQANPMKLAHTASGILETKVSHQESCQPRNSGSSSRQAFQQRRTSSAFDKLCRELGEHAHRAPECSNSPKAAVRTDSAVSKDAAGDDQHRSDLIRSRKSGFQHEEKSTKSRVPPGMADSAVGGLATLSSPKKGAGKEVAALIFGKQCAFTPPEEKEGGSPAEALQQGKLSNGSSSASRAMTNSSADGKTLPPSQQEAGVPFNAYSIQTPHAFHRSSRVCNGAHKCKTPTEHLLENPEVLIACIHFLFLMILLRQ